MSSVPTTEKACGDMVGLLVTRSTKHTVKFGTINRVIRAAENSIIQHGMWCMQTEWARRQCKLKPSNTSQNVTWITKKRVQH